MNPNQKVKVPAASHGLHRHKINVPRMFTKNFYEHIPSYSWKFRKGEKLDIQYNFFNRLNPLPVPSLVTGKTSIRGYFVPMRTIFKGWNDFSQKTPHVYPDGTSATISKRRYFRNDRFVSVFLGDANLASQVTSTDPYDIKSTTTTLGVYEYWTLTAFGCAVLKIFNALGYMPSWDVTDQQEFDATRALAYIRIMVDHYFPKQYVGNASWVRFFGLCEWDQPGSTEVSCADLIDGVGHFIYGYYDDSVFSNVWDYPDSPNVGLVHDTVINDQTNNAQYGNMSVTDFQTSTDSPGPGKQPTNGTPFIKGNNVNGAGAVGNNGPSAFGVVTQYIIDSLQALNNWMRRHQLGGSRWIDQFLLQRGILPDSRDMNTSYKLDSYSIPFEVDDVTSNSDLALKSDGSLTSMALGELAGKGHNSSEGVKIRFEDTFDTDGVFMVIEVALPDNDQICSVDPTNLEISPLDSLDPTYDKLGTDLVPSRILYQNLDGSVNYVINSNNFGFLNRYWQECFDVPMVFGDFNVASRGKTTLESYHSFRDLTRYVYMNSGVLNHSYSYLRVGTDTNQYSRLFYTDKQDNMITSVRIKGTRYTQKLPLGESFDWDDDEFNNKVDLIVSGGQK